VCVRIGELDPRHQNGVLGSSGRSSAQANQLIVLQNAELPDGPRRFQGLKFVDRLGGYVPVTGQTSGAASVGDVEALCSLYNWLSKRLASRGDADATDTVAHARFSTGTKSGRREGGGLQLELVPYTPMSRSNSRSSGLPLVSSI
jgi:hypothetical protein